MGNVSLKVLEKSLNEISVQERGTNPVGGKKSPAHKVIVILKKQDNLDNLG